MADEQASVTADAELVEIWGLEAMNTFLNSNLCDSIFGYLGDDMGVPEDVIWKEQFKEGLEIGKKYISEKINLIVLCFMLSF